MEAIEREEKFVHEGKQRRDHQLVEAERNEHLKQVEDRRFQEEEKAHQRVEAVKQDIQEEKEQKERQ